MTDANYRYSENGFWVKKEDGFYVIGLSEKGQDDLGTVSFIDLPEKGSITTEDALISVEAAKAMTDLSSPLNGEVVEVNELLADQPELLNNSDQTQTWIVKLTHVDEQEFENLLTESGL